MWYLHSIVTENSSYKQSKISVYNQGPRQDARLLADFHVITCFLYGKMVNSAVLAGNNDKGTSKRMGCYHGTCCIKV